MSETQTAGLTLRAGRSEDAETCGSICYAAFKAIAVGKKEPHASQFKILKGSPLNVRVGGPGDAHLVKTMLNMLPKPKIKPPSSPFEEAQW